MGVLDVRILDIVDIFYDRLDHAPVEPDAWRKWYPHPATIGLIDYSQFPEKPQLPVHPVFPRMETIYKFQYIPLNPNPTIRDCLTAATLSDYLIHGTMALMGPLRLKLYEVGATRFHYIRGTVISVTVSSVVFLMSSATRLLGLKPANSF